MKNYIYQNKLVGKKQLRQILGWSFSNYNSMQACILADELKYIGFKYATQSGISISIEDLQVPFVKNLMLKRANLDISNSEKVYLKGKINNVERFQKIIDTWNLTSESLKEQIIYYFKNYDPLNSVYIMAFSGARGNLSQVRQLVGMRGLMSDPSGEIMNLPIKHNFREGLTITDYLMSGYGARKGIIDTALKTANSGYLTRRLIDVAQDILIREIDCKTNHAFLIFNNTNDFNHILGRVLNKPIIDPITFVKIADKNTQITQNLIDILLQKSISQIYIKSPLTCKLYRAICQQCYGWDLATENLVDIGEAIGILAGQSIGEPGTQLTMRTFHTGGIFTAEIREKITSPIEGIIKFSHLLKTVALRTNRGENVLVTKNKGYLIIIPKLKERPILKLEILTNTILFPTNGQYVQPNTLLGELININKQLKQEIKPILSLTAGEVIVPNLKIPDNHLKTNKLIWLLSGELYNSPLNSYINFYFDYKLNKNSYIFRTKIVSKFSGNILDLNKESTLYKRNIFIKNNVLWLNNITISQLISKIGNANHLCNFQNRLYLLYTTLKNNRAYLKTTRKNQIGHLITNHYKTKTGGILHYDWRILKYSKNNELKINFYKNRNNFKINNKFSKVIHQTLIWIEEETYSVNCNLNVALARHGDFIAENFEITPGCFSKTSGLVLFKQKNNIIKTITIQSGLIYEGNAFSEISKKLYFPGEKMFSQISIHSPSLCDCINVKKRDQLLISPIQLYEFSFIKNKSDILSTFNKTKKKLNTTNDLHLMYQSNQKIKVKNSINLILTVLNLKITHSSSNDISIKLESNQRQGNIQFKIFNHLKLNNYITPELKYKNLESCPLIKKNQFIDQYSTFIYLESLTFKSLEIVKIKIKTSTFKQILLISNDNCLTIKKQDVPGKKLNDFILNGVMINQVGKLIFENKNSFTLQKGRPYFFPNCEITSVRNQVNLKYKFLPYKRNKKNSVVNKEIDLNLNRVSRLNASVETTIKSLLKNKNKFNCIPPNSKVPLKIKLSKMFLKKNGRLYSCLIPRFLNQFNIGCKTNTVKLPYNSFFNYKKKEASKLNRTLLMQSSEMNSNYSITSKLTLVKFLEYPLLKTTKSIGLYSITEDFFEEELNSVFCYNNQFIENGAVMGLLHLEKEITGDIVQGLPRIEEVLEARKKKQMIKQIPTNKKKGLLSQHTSLDPNYNFHRLGTVLKETEKINPHKLLKVYFNYYGLLRPFYSDIRKEVLYTRLISNFEGSYKSFKKVQAFILNSVQNVYKSQGVTINDKHLEVIIKQMTTKVLVTEEGDTPLLKREIIDLYHIEYINKIMLKENKNKAYYLPLLFGITRAALNNPSFISAASFQETTRVLTKAAIEGRIDWLRGLKENIIIGHLIPAGTGSRNYKNSFKKLPYKINKK